MRCQCHDIGQISTSKASALSGIKVLDRSVLILKSVAETPCILAELCKDTGLPRATAHHPATALEVYRLVTRTPDGRWTTGSGLTEITPVTTDLLTDTAAHILPKLVETTGESVQLYRLTGDTRICIASMEPATGLRNTTSVGSRMPLIAGSTACAPLAFSPANLVERILLDADFNQQGLDDCRRLGWFESMGERDPAPASASVPVFDGNQRMIAVLSVSGPVEHMVPSLYKCWGARVLVTAEEMSPRL